jgi:hypothetical protein
VFGYRLMRWPSIGVASTLLFAAALWHFLPRASETEGRAVAATMRVAPMQIGVNLPSLDAFSGQRVFANLATVSRWRSAGNRPWTIMPPDQLDKDGAVKFLEPGQVAPLFLASPPGPFKSVRVQCRFQGEGKLNGHGFLTYRGQFGNRVDFDATWRPDDPNGYIQIFETNPRNPLRSVDCREPHMPSDATFDAAFIRALKGFKVIRFLDWQWVNNNQGGNWANFVSPGHQSFSLAPEGTRPDLMVELANQAAIDPWFIMPYRADDHYIRSFANLVKERLAPDRKVYVEFGNEIWNYANPATQQALKEGNALGLSSNEHQALLLRYAQKSRNALKIWSEVFKSDEHRLIRVVSTQNVNPGSAKIVLGHEDLANYVDALATAPYFYAKTDSYGMDSLDGLFAELDRSVNAAIDFALKNKAVANSFGKRYIAYEAGQHLVIKDAAYARAVQRDPRMGKAYVRYLTLWQEQVGDLIVQYSLTGSIGGSGAWGLREYADQPPAEAPKWQAVQQFLK